MSLRMARVCGARWLWMLLWQARLGHEGVAMADPKRRHRQVPRLRPRQPKPASPWLGVAMAQPGPVIAAAAAVAYMLGYVQLGLFASRLGVPLSAFGLDFREYVILSLANLLWIAALVGAYKLGRYVQRRQPTTARWADRLIKVSVILGAAWGYALLFADLPDLPTSATPALTIFTSIAAAAFVGAFRERNPHRVRRARLVLGIYSFLVLWMTTSFILQAATVIRTGEIQTSGTTLDLVVRPLPTILLESDVTDLAYGYEGTEVILVSNRGGQSVYVQDQIVVVTPSSDLVFIAPPVDNTNDATPSPPPDTE
jgi:hypothetical protein